MDQREKEEERPRIVDFIHEQLGDSDAMLAEGFDDAIIGIGYRCGQPAILVYDTDKALKILVNRDGMDLDEAKEFFDFNVAGAWVGEGTPIWMEEIMYYERIGDNSMKKKVLRTSLVRWFARKISKLDGWLWRETWR